MRLSCSTDCLGRMSLSRSLPMLADAGFGHVELCCAEIEAAYGGNDGAAEAVEGLLDECGLHLSGLRIGTLTAATMDEVGSQAAAMRRRMALAYDLGLPEVIVDAGQRRAQPLEMLVLELQSILEIAAGLELRILLANKADSRVEQLEDMRFVLVQVPDARLAALVDAGAFHSSAVNPRDALSECARRLGGVHITDQIGHNPQPLGAGEMNVPAILDQLRRMGYNGWLTFDQDCTLRPRPVEYLRDAQRYLEI